MCAQNAHQHPENKLKGEVSQAEVDQVVEEYLQRYFKYNLASAEELKKLQGEAENRENSATDQKQKMFAGAVVKFVQSEDILWDKSTYIRDC